MAQESIHRMMGNTLCDPTAILLCREAEMITLSLVIDNPCQEHPYS